MKYINKYSKIILVVIFICGLLAYGYIARQYDNPTYLGVDEELYVNMASSFFFEGGFSQNYETLTYNCVLYSVILAISYFFYTPEHIVFIMRMIGVVLMISSIFPIYLLSKEVLKDKVKAIFITAFSLLLPEVLLSSYLVQEVLCYPMFLWIIYLAYMKFSDKSNKIQNVLLIILLGLIFFVKSYAIIFPAAYFATLLFIDLKNKDYKDIKNVIIKGILCLITIIVGILLVKLLNEFQVGGNHYSSQISSIFPITMKTVTSYIYGTFFYTVFFLFCMGFLPVIIPLLNINKYEKQDKKLIIFLLLSTILAILEIVMIVFLAEEAGKNHPDSFHFRYFALFTIPYILMFLKCKKEEVIINKRIIAIYIISFAYLIWYYLKGGTASTAISAFFIYSIEAINQKISYTFGAILMVLLALTSAIMIILNKTKIIKDAKNAFIILTIIGLIIICPVSYRIHLNSNKEIGLNAFESDFVKTANYIKRDYDKVYMLQFSSGYNRNVRTGFINLISEYKVIDLEKENKTIEEIENQKIVVITSKDFTGIIEGAEKVDIGTQYTEVYVSDKKYQTLKIEMQNENK